MKTVKEFVDQFGWGNQESIIANRQMMLEFAHAVAAFVVGKTTPQEMSLSFLASDGGVDSKSYNLAIANMKEAAKALGIEV